MLDACKKRLTEMRTFCAGKPGHEETIEEWGEVYTDDTGIRAVIFYYRHSTGNVVRSVKRLVKGKIDYRLPMPNATETSNPIAVPKKKKTENPK